MKVVKKVVIIVVLLALVGMFVRTYQRSNLTSYIIESARYVEGSDYTENYFDIVCRRDNEHTSFAVSEQRVQVGTDSILIRDGLGMFKVYMYKDFYKMVTDSENRGEWINVEDVPEDFT